MLHCTMLASFNNRAQNRIATCHVHDNYFDIRPVIPLFPKLLLTKTGLEPSLSGPVTASTHSLETMPDPS